MAAVQNLRVLGNQLALGLGAQVALHLLHHRLHALGLLTQLVPLTHQRENLILQLVLEPRHHQLDRIPDLAHPLILGILDALNVALDFLDQTHQLHVAAPQRPYLLADPLFVELVHFVQRLEAVRGVLAAEQGTLVAYACLAGLAVHTQLFLLV